MKYTALSLFVIGVATVNAGTVTTYSSTSGANAGNQQVGLASGNGATFGLQSSGSAQVIAHGQGAAAGGSSSQGWNSVSGNTDWEALCDEDQLEECHHNIHLGAAGSGASGDAVSNTVIIAAGEQVIPAQVI